MAFRTFLVSNDAVRAVVVTDDDTHVAFPRTDNNLIDTREPKVISGFEDLSDDAGISEQSHLPNHTLERVTKTFLGL